MNRIRVGIIFGGRSAEHEVSLVSARNVIQALDSKKYEVTLIGIDPSGRWHLNDASRFLLSDTPDSVTATSSSSDVLLVPGERAGALITRDDPLHAAASVDVVFPVLHGTFGEDGTMQGLLKLADLPFVGPGVLGSAVGMDKEITKRILRDVGIPIVPFEIVRAGRTRPSSQEIVSRLGLPLFVKPANLGSSVGIKKAKSAAELDAAIEYAFQFDRKVLVEAFVEAREIECGVLGNDDPKASVLGEIRTGPQHEFYSYEAKYLDNEGQELVIPAELPAEVSDKIRRAAVDAFTALGCEGMARVDFFVTPAGEFYVNEINTIPGFTSISMYPKLWEATGIPYSELIDRLIRLALERHAAESKLMTSRSSD